MVVVLGFNVMFFVSGTVGSFGSWKFICAPFPSMSLSFRGRREARALVEFCTGTVVVASITLVSAEEKRELLRSLVTGLPVSVPASSVTPGKDPEVV